MATDNPVAKFDRIAKAYRWMEYFSFGTLLERCRFAHLECLGEARHALVLGDGDGRFLTRLLQHYPEIQADVVERSASMQALVEKRLAKIGADKRACFFQCDALKFQPLLNTHYDLIVSHFFLDCLTNEEIERLLRRLAPHLTTGASWLVSEFAVPDRYPSRFAGYALVRSLYFAFRWLTGLRVQKLPDYSLVLRRSGFARVRLSTYLGGILRSELWQSFQSIGHEPNRGNSPSHF